MQKLSTGLLIVCGAILLTSITIQYWSVINTIDFWLNAGILIGFVGITVGGIMKFINTNHKKESDV